MYCLRFTQDVVKDMRGIPAYYRARIMDAMESELVYNPETPTRNKKILVNLNPPWHAEPPIWELRIGDYRVFYDVEEHDKTVFIRVIRLKSRGSRTEDIL